MTESFFGFKVATVIAGFVGAVISLAYIKNLTKGKAFLTVLAGAFSAAYFTIPAIAWAGLSSQWENGAAFLIGLIGMNFLAGFFKLFEKFSEDPLGMVVHVWNIWRGKKND